VGGAERTGRKVEVTDADLGGAVVGADKWPRLLAFLREQIAVYDRSGHLKARVGPPQGILGLGESIGSDISWLCHPDDMEKLVRMGAFGVASSPGWQTSGRLRLRHVDGTWRTCEVRVWNCVDDPDIEGFVIASRLVFDDGEEQGQFVGPDGAPLDELTPALTATLEVPTMAIDPQRRVRFATPAVQRMLGRSRDDLYGTDLAELLEPLSRLRLLGILSQMRADETQTALLTFDRPGDGQLDAEVRIIASGVGDRRGMATLVLTDRSTEPALVRMAMRDPLTGVANRAWALETIAGHLESGDEFAVLFADIDGLKAVNDELGHAAGDAAIVVAARQLESFVADDGLVARIGGDEFIVICPDFDEPAATALAGRLVATASVRADGSDGTRLSVGSTVAVSGDDPESILRRADQAMFADKRRVGDRAQHGSQRSPGPGG
jgi:diguanylate cyclase (GGDEF)-like protein